MVCGHECPGKRTPKAQNICSSEIIAYLSNLEVCNRTRGLEFPKRKESAASLILRFMSDNEKRAVIYTARFRALIRVEFSVSLGWILTRGGGIRLARLSQSRGGCRAEGALAKLIEGKGHKR